MLINDQTPDYLLFPDLYGRGPTVARGRWLERGAGFSAEDGEPYPAELLIPESEWQDRIQEMARLGSDPKSVAQVAGVKVKNQERTNYCWMNATVSALEYKRAAQNQATVELSPASAAAPCTGYRNSGGWGQTAIAWLKEHGVAPTSAWPANAIDRRYATPETLAKASLYRVPRWWIIDSWQAIVSALLRGDAISAGFNWWGHQVLLVSLTVVDGEVCPVIQNSWDVTWGDKGFGVLQGRRKLPDDAVCPIEALPA